MVVVISKALTVIINNFPTMFSILSDTNAIIFTEFNKSSANAINLDQTKVLSSSKELCAFLVSNPFPNDKFKSLKN